MSGQGLELEWTGSTTRNLSVADKCFDLVTVNQYNILVKKVNFTWFPFINERQTSQQGCYLALVSTSIHMYWG